MASKGLHLRAVHHLPFLCRTVEEHPPGYECGKDELLFEGTLKDVDVIAAEEGDGAEKDKSPDYGDEEEEDEEPEEESSDSDGSMDDLEEAVARRKGEVVACHC